VSQEEAEVFREQRGLKSGEAYEETLETGSKKVELANKLYRQLRNRHGRLTFDDVLEDLEEAERILNIK
jgi:hypothetical protein